MYVEKVVGEVDALGSVSWDGSVFEDGGVSRLASWRLVEVRLTALEC